jgi:hypothetical protein
MPDMGIDYGKPDDNSLMADKPSLVVEALSPTTGGFDVTIKLAEYQGLLSRLHTVRGYGKSDDSSLSSRQWRALAGRGAQGLDAVDELKKSKVSVPLTEHLRRT